MERGVAAAGEGFPSHQLPSIVHQGGAIEVSGLFRSSSPTGPPWCDLSKHDASSAVRKTRPAKSPATTEELRARRSHWRRL